MPSDFIIVRSFQNYIDAHITKGRLEEEGIDCWLKDENTVTIDPILTNAVGGIKLIVARSQAEKALELLNEYRREEKTAHPCPSCGSHNTDLVTTPRKASNWIAALFGFLFGSYALHVEKVRHCFDCAHEFPDSVNEN